MIVHTNTEVQSKTSGYTTLSVYSRSFPSENNKVRSSRDITLDNATYNCPWVNAPVRRSTPTLFNDCPCDLLTVIAKHKWIGNCFLIKMKGRSPSRVVSLMQGSSRN